MIKKKHTGLLMGMKAKYLRLGLIVISSCEFDVVFIFQ